MYEPGVDVKVNLPSFIHIPLISRFNIQLVNKTNALPPARRPDYSARLIARKPECGSCHSSNIVISIRPKSSPKTDLGGRRRIVLLIGLGHFVRGRRLLTPRSSTKEINFGMPR
jgi:hypothetical protein